MSFTSSKMACRNRSNHFTREEVPISYGLAVDTSGSLRSQLQSVIDAGKTIINSNKPGDETFLVRFISSDKIETVQDFTANKELLMDGLDQLLRRRWSNRDHRCRLPIRRTRFAIQEGR